MIFLAITPEGLRKALEVADGHHRIWCGSDAVSESDEEFKRVSCFNYPLKGADKDVLEDALETIKEHHPDQIIWIEGNTSD